MAKARKLPKSAATGRIVKKSALKSKPKTTYAQTIKKGKKK
jgi:hypothetical protein